MRILRATPAHIEAIRATWPERELGEFPEDAVFWVALESGTILGHASARRGPEGDVTLSSAWTEPRARGRGIQTRLIRARVRWARKLGASRVETYTWGGNLPSIRALIRCGFVPVSRWWDGAQSWLSWVRQI